MFTELAMWGSAVLIIQGVSGITYTSDVFLQGTGLLGLYTFISITFMIWITTFIKSVNAFGTVSGILGTVIEFTSEIYMPLSELPEVVKKFLRLFLLRI